MNKSFIEKTRQRCAFIAKCFVGTNYLVRQPAELTQPEVMNANLLLLTDY